MPHTAIYGASDDLIEVSGAFSEEYSAYGVPRHLTVELAHGEALTLIMGFLSPGVWRVATIAVQGSPTFSLVPARETDNPSAFGDDEDGCPPHSEKLILPGVVNDITVREATEAEVSAAFPSPHGG